jgi:hypothetical protein
MTAQRCRRHLRQHLWGVAHQHADMSGFVAVEDPCNAAAVAAASSTYRRHVHRQDPCLIATPSSSVRATINC